MSSSNPSQILIDDLNIVFIPLSVADIKRLEWILTLLTLSSDQRSDKDVALKQFFDYVLHNVEQFKVSTHEEGISR